MTDAEKVAWANDNGVQPPAFVLARLENAIPQTCSKTTGCTKCSKVADTIETAETLSSANSNRQIVLLDAQLRCQGVNAWITLLSSAIPVERVAELPHDAVVAAGVTALEPSYIGPIYSPPHRPPRRFA